MTTDGSELMSVMSEDQWTQWSTERGERGGFLSGRESDELMFSEIGSVLIEK